MSTDGLPALAAGLRSEQGGASDSPIVTESDGALSALAEYECPKIA